MDKLMAAQELQRLATMFKGVVEVADQLESMGKAEQGIKEADKRKAAIEKEIARLSDAQKDAEDKLVAMRGELAEQAELFKGAERDHKQRLNAETKKAGEQRQKNVDDARAELDRLAKEIEAARAKVQTETAAERTRVESEFSDLKKATMQAAEELKEVQGKLDAARKALAKLGLTVDAG